MVNALCAGTVLYHILIIIYSIFIKNYIRYLVNTDNKYNGLRIVLNTINKYSKYIKNINNYICYLVNKVIK